MVQFIYVSTFLRTLHLYIWFEDINPSWINIIIEPGWPSWFFGSSTGYGPGKPGPMNEELVGLGLTWWANMNRALKLAKHTRGGRGASFFRHNLQKLTCTGGAPCAGPSKTSSVCLYSSTSKILTMSSQSSQPKP